MVEKKTLVVFAPEEKHYIRSEAYNLWECIGYDVLQCIADDWGKNIFCVNIDRDEVIEVVLDAGRLEEKLRKDINTSNPVMTQDLLDRWKSASHEQKITIMKSVFTDARYGM
jgi:hypothetical protein